MTIPTSTINPTQPPEGSPLTSTPLRNNFQAAYNDINNLYTQVAGVTSGFGTMSLQNANNVSITGGTINGTTIGLATPAAGKFTTLLTTSSITASGNITGANLSGTNTGDQVITLSGVVSGTGTTSISTNIANNLITSAMLRQGAGLSVIGVTGSSTANEADIVGTANQVLRVNSAGSSLAFGAVNLASSAAVTGNLPVTNLNSGTGASSTTAWFGDATWKTVGSGTITSVGVTGANGIGVSGSPITSSGTIALSLGAITPSSVLASGTVGGSNLSGTNTGDQMTSGTSNRVTVTNGTTNPTIDIASTYVGQASITTLGAITTGVWNASAIAVNKGGTGATTANAGLNALLPSQTGNSGQVLGTDGTNTSWVSAGGTPTTTKGDLIVRSSTIDSRLSVGTDGQVLLADSAQTLGVKWSTVTGTGTVTSVAVSGGTTGLTVSGSPITGAGTITLAGTLIVANGGIGITSGTSGGVPYFSGSTTIASSAQLATNAVVVGGGSANPPISSPMTVDHTTGAVAGFVTTLNNQVGTTYTLLSTDTGKTVTFNNASAITVTLPNNLAIGFTCECIQLGAGQVTFSAASGATLQNRQSQSNIAGQYGAARLTVVTNSGGTSAVYNLAGDTA